MISVDNEMFLKTRQVDLGEWLLNHHPDDVIRQGNSVLLRKDLHVSVGPGFHGYYNFKTGESGNAVNYLRNFLGYRFPDAVLALTGDGDALASDHRKKEHAESREPGSLEVVEKLPEPAGDFRRLFAYLHGRGIPYSVIQRVVDSGKLYQSVEGNIVFITAERDYYELRGTNSFADRRCKRRFTCEHFCEGEHGWCTRMSGCADYKKSPFHGGSSVKKGKFWYFSDFCAPYDAVFVCEGAVDALSLYVIHQYMGGQERFAYTGIGGAGNQDAIDLLRAHQKVILAVDNDETGDDCRARNPDLETFIPVGKDWNDDLQTGAWKRYTGYGLNGNVSKDLADKSY